MEVYCIKGQEGLSLEPNKVYTGRIYTVSGESECTCGTKMYDVGLRNDSVDIIGTKCLCGIVTISGIAWKRASRFVPIDDIDISELVEESEKLFV